MDPDPLYWLTVLSRWVHVGTAIVVVGGSAFMRFVLLPSAATLPEAEHQSLRRAVMDRWRPLLHAGIALFLLSGLYNFWMQLKSHKGDGLYHGLMGTKILLALAVFGLAEMLAGRSASAERRRQNSRTWLALILTLAAMIVAISGYLKVRGAPERRAPDEVSLAAPADAGFRGAGF